MGAIFCWLAERGHERCLVFDMSIQIVDYQGCKVVDVLSLHNRALQPDNPPS